MMRPTYPPSRTWWLWLEDVRFTIVDAIVRAKRSRWRKETRHG